MIFKQMMESGTHTCDQIDDQEINLITPRGINWGMAYQLDTKKPRNAGLFQK